MSTNSDIYNDDIQHRRWLVSANDNVNNSTGSSTGGPTKVFPGAAMSVHANQGTEDFRIASIRITTDGSSFTICKLPLIAISDMTHTIRTQVESTLNGDVYLLSGGEGAASCTLTCLECVPACQASEVSSALKIYNSWRQNNSKNSQRISVEIHELGNPTNTLVKFTGVIQKCSVTASAKDSQQLIFVTLALVGVWE